VPAPSRCARRPCPWSPAPRTAIAPAQYRPTRRCPFPGVASPANRSFPAPVSHCPCQWDRQWSRSTSTSVPRIRCSADVRPGRARPFGLRQWVGNSAYRVQRPGCRIHSISRHGLYAADMAGKGPPATAALTRQRVTYELHSYEHNADNGSYGAQAVTELGLDPARVCKTLVADVDGSLVVAVVPMTGQLDPQALPAPAG